jgi:hypothetical protein
MKGEIIVDLSTGQVRVNVILEAIADAGAAMEAIRNASRSCWPNIMFADETLDETDQTYESFETPAPCEGAQGAEGDESPAADGGPIPETPRVEAFIETASPQGPRQFDRSAPPKPGSLSEKVLEACRRLRTVNYKRIRDELEIDGGASARLIAHLQRGGHLEGLPCT